MIAEAEEAPRNDVGEPAKVCVEAELAGEIPECDRDAWLKDNDLWDGAASATVRQRTFDVFSKVSFGDCAWKPVREYLREIAHLEG